ncbi:hypothetical protein VC187_01690, partial [Xanthomonas campestris]|nr:hypothetical protein [Xanthomonas campestris]MEA9506257.1 hypothetical protein [Xanthomonas campestris]
MKLSKILLLLLLNITFSAGAEQGCPPGQFPIGGQGAVACAPIPQTGSGPKVSPRLHRKHHLLAHCRRQCAQAPY